MLVKAGRKTAPIKWLGWIECACVCCDLTALQWWVCDADTEIGRGLAFLIVNQESSPMSRHVDTSSHQLPIATLLEALLAPFYKWGIWVSESFHTCSKLHCWSVTRTEFKCRKRRCGEFASLNRAFCWDKHFIFPGHQASWAEDASSLQQWMTDSHSQTPQQWHSWWVESDSACPQGLTAMAQIQGQLSLENCSDSVWSCASNGQTNCWVCSQIIALISR